jgi:hypothetical protein
MATVIRGLAIGLALSAGSWASAQESAASPPTPVVFNHPLSARPGTSSDCRVQTSVLAGRAGEPETVLPTMSSHGSQWVAARIPPDATGALVLRVLNTHFGVGSR